MMKLDLILSGDSKNDKLSNQPGYPVMTVPKMKVSPMANDGIWMLVAHI